MRCLTEEEFIRIHGVVRSDVPYDIYMYRLYKQGHFVWGPSSRLNSMFRRHKLDAELDKAEKLKMIKMACEL